MIRREAIKALLTLPLFSAAEEPKVDLFPLPIVVALKGDQPICSECGKPILVGEPVVLKMGYGEAMQVHFRHGYQAMLKKTRMEMAEEGAKK